MRVQMNAPAAPAADVAIDTTTPAYYWAVLREYLSFTFSLFGDPVSIAKKLWLHKSEHKLCNDWLRVLEGLLRRLIFLDARDYKLEPTPERKRTPLRLMPAGAGASFDSDDSSTWRVSFKLDAAPPQPPRPKRGARCAAPNTQAKLPNARWSTPLALRFEALIRGFNNPAPLVRRCARLLQRNAERVRALIKPVRREDRAKPGFAELIAFDALFGASPPTRANPHRDFRDSS